MPHRQRSPFLPVVLIAFCLQAAGCGRAEPKSDEEPTGGPTAKEALDDLARLLEHLKNENKKMPATLRNIEPIEPLFPGAYLGLIQDNIVYVWGAPLNPSGSERVLAFEKNARTEEAWVLMQDGTVKQMTSAALSTAPKARP